MASRPDGRRRLSPSDALAFFDPFLAGADVAVDVIRALLNPGRNDAPVEIPRDSWQLVLDRVDFHRLFPQLASAGRDGRIVMNQSMSEGLDRVMSELTLKVLKLEQLLVVVGDEFQREGLEFLVLKGLATSHIDHVSPQERIAVDLDVLVRPGQLDTATEILESAGFGRPYELESLMDKGRAMRDSLGRHVDLHVRPHAPGKALGETWWNSTETFDLAGRKFKALPRGGRLGHAASHLALSWPSSRRFSSLLDMAVILEQSDDDDRDVAERFLDDVGVSDIVMRVTHLAATMLDRQDLVLGRPSRWPHDRLLRRAYDRPDDDTIAMKLATIVGMPWGERDDVARNWIRPSQEYLRRGGYRSRTDRAVKVLRRAGGRGAHPRTDPPEVSEPEPATPPG